MQNIKTDRHGKEEIQGEYFGIRGCARGGGIRQLAAKEAYETGIVKGKEMGIEEGQAEGIEQGRKETLVTTAKNLLKLGISPSDIARATGLTVDKISVEPRI